MPASLDVVRPAHTDRTRSRTRRTCLTPADIDVFIHRLVEAGNNLATDYAGNDMRHAIHCVWTTRKVYVSRGGILTQSEDHESEIDAN